MSDAMQAEVIEEGIKGYGHRLEPPKLPEVGQPVVFFPRPGELRSRIDRVPAFVQAIDPLGNAELLAFFAADDARTVVQVPPHSDQNPRGWKLFGAEVVDNGEWKAAHDALLERLTKSEKEVSDLVDYIFSDDLPDAAGMTGIFADFHRRVSALEQRAAILAASTTTKKAPVAKKKAAKGR